MTKRHRIVETKTDERQRPRVKPTVVSRLARWQAGPVEQPAGSGTAFRKGGMGVQAAWLGDGRLQGAQRCALAAQIGRRQGNDYLQRVVASLRKEKRMANPVPVCQMDLRAAEAVQAFAARTDIVQQTGNIIQRAKSTVLNGTKNEQKSARSALKKAERMVNKAQIRIGGKRRGRYKTWYDTHYSPTDATAKTRFDATKKGWVKIHSVFLSKRIFFDCSARNENYYAEVDTRDGRYKIKLGKDFWSAAETGRDSRGGAIVHEISHEELDTDDHAYGEADAKQLAQNDPDKAAENADNWEYYAEDSY